MWSVTRSGEDEKSVQYEGRLQHQNEAGRVRTAQCNRNGTG